MSRFIYITLSILLFIFLSNDAIASEPRSPVKTNTDTVIIDGTDYPALYLNTPNLQGEAVWMVQARLRELGYEIEPTGLYNLKTSEVIKLFQTANRLNEDGMVTRPVWDRLMYDTVTRQRLADATNNRRVRIEIDVKKRRLTVLEGEKIIRVFPVAVGKTETPSPLGEWEVALKNVGWGNGFGSRWLGLNVPWGIFGIHGTNKPYSIGDAQSHGCIRMHNRDVEKLYKMIPVGTRVKIMENGRIAPRHFIPVKLYRSCSGQRVVYVQSRLKEIGICLVNADGVFGTTTEVALKYFQAWHGLEITGQTDEATYKALGMMKE